MKLISLNPDPDSTESRRSLLLFIEKPFNFVNFVFGYKNQDTDPELAKFLNTDPDSLILDPKDWSKEIYIERTSTQCGYL